MKKADNLNLRNCNTWRIDTTAKTAYFPESIEDMTSVLSKLEKPLILGACSNVLFSSNGVTAPIVFTSGLNKINFKDGIFEVECGVKSPIFSNFAFSNSISGFEFLAQIPASIGGNIYMNSGAFNQSISDVIVSCRVYDLLRHRIYEVEKNKLGFAYRTSSFKKHPGRCVILSAKFQGKKKDINIIREKMEENISIRSDKQPSLKYPNAGSVFKNPPNHSAGELLDKCEVKNLRLGGAVVYEKHANFIINDDNATSVDILRLMNEMKRRVKDRFEINLEPEIIFIGDKTEEEEELWKKLITK